METPNPVCESTQQEISFALDERRTIPKAALDHALLCHNCAAFLSAWEGGLHAMLASPLPVAGIALRESVLAMPRGFHSTKASRSWRSSISAIAAAILLGAFGYALIDIRPAPAREQTHQSAAGEELAALKSDLRRSLSALRGPADAMQNVLGR